MDEIIPPDCNIVRKYTTNRLHTFLQNLKCKQRINKSFYDKPVLRSEKEIDRYRLKIIVGKESVEEQLEYAQNHKRDKYLEDNFSEKVLLTQEAKEHARGEVDRNIGTQEDKNCKGCAEEKAELCNNNVANESSNSISSSQSDKILSKPFCLNALTKPWALQMVCFHKAALEYLPKYIRSQKKKEYGLENEASLSDSLSNSTEVKKNDVIPGLNETVSLSSETQSASSKDRRDHISSYFCKKIDDSNEIHNEYVPRVSSDTFSSCPRTMKESELLEPFMLSQSNKSKPEYERVPDEREVGIETCDSTCQSLPSTPNESPYIPNVISSENVHPSTLVEVSEQNEVPVFAQMTYPCEEQEYTDFNNQNYLACDLVSEDIPNSFESMLMSRMSETQNMSKYGDLIDLSQYKLQNKPQGRRADILVTDPLTSYPVGGLRNKKITMCMDEDDKLLKNVEGLGDIVSFSPPITNKSPILFESQERKIITVESSKSIGFETTEFLGETCKYAPNISLCSGKNKSHEEKLSSDNDILNSHANNCHGDEVKEEKDSFLNASYYFETTDSHEQNFAQPFSSDSFDLIIKRMSVEDTRENGRADSDKDTRYEIAFENRLSGTVGNDHADEDFNGSKEQVVHVDVDNNNLVESEKFLVRNDCSYLKSNGLARNTSVREEDVLLEDTYSRVTVDTSPFLSSSHIKDDITDKCDANLLVCRNIMSDILDKSPTRSVTDEDIVQSKILDNMALNCVHTLSPQNLIATFMHTPDPQDITLNIVSPLNEDSKLGIPNNVESVFSDINACKMDALSDESFQKKLLATKSLSPLKTIIETRAKSTENCTSGSKKFDDTRRIHRAKKDSVAGVIEYVISKFTSPNNGNHISANKRYFGPVDIVKASISAEPINPCKFKESVMAMQSTPEEKPLSKCKKRNWQLNVANKMNLDVEESLLDAVDAVDDSSITLSTEERNMQGQKFSSYSGVVGHLPNLSQFFQNIGVEEDKKLTLHEVHCKDLSNFDGDHRQKKVTKRKTIHIHEGLFIDDVEEAKNAGKDCKVVFERILNENVPKGVFTPSCLEYDSFMVPLKCEMISHSVLRENVPVNNIVDALGKKLNINFSDKLTTPKHYLDDFRAMPEKAQKRVKCTLKLDIKDGTFPCEISRDKETAVDQSKTRDVHCTKEEPCKELTKPDSRKVKHLGDDAKSKRFKDEQSLNVIKREGAVDFIDDESNLMSPGSLDHHVLHDHAKQGLGKLIETEISICSAKDLDITMKDNSCTSNHCSKIEDFPPKKLKQNMSDTEYLKSSTNIRDHCTKGIINLNVNGLKSTQQYCTEKNIGIGTHNKTIGKNESVYVDTNSKGAVDVRVDETRLKSFSTKECHIHLDGAIQYLGKRAKTKINRRIPLSLIPEATIRRAPQKIYKYNNGVFCTKNVLSCKGKQSFKSVGLALPEKQMRNRNNVRYLKAYRGMKDHFTDGHIYVCVNRPDSRNQKHCTNRCISSVTQNILKEDKKLRTIKKKRQKVICETLTSGAPLSTNLENKAFNSSEVQNSCTSLKRVELKKGNVRAVQGTLKMTKENVKTEKKEEKKGEEKKDGDIKDEMSEEDKQLVEELNMLVERLQEPNVTLYKPALEQIRSLIRSSTTSMTSVPKPLKFMRTHYDTMKEIYEKIKDNELKKFTADIVSVLAMTMSEERECLKYRLLGFRGDIGDWGHEYVRHLAGEIAQEWETLGDDDGRRAELISEAHVIVPYHMQHNAEAEACDLLMEMEQLDLLTSQDYVDKDAYPRVCLYLTSCVPYVPDPENTNLLQTALQLYRKFGEYPQAMRLALQLHDYELIKQLFDECPDKYVKLQVAFMLGRQQVFLELPEDMDDFEDLTEILSNSHLNTHFLSLGRELDIMDPKTPEDIYKSHLENSRPTFGPNQVDSARQNLASSFVNGFVNAAFGTDKLLTEDGNKWLYKNKEHGMLSATASLGLILLWDVEGGLTQIDKYLYSSEDFIKAGALLACGIVNSGVRNECDPALALLSDYIGHKTMVISIGSILGLGLAYAGSNREGVLKVLTPVLTEEKSSMEVIGIAALSCGMIAVGTSNQLVVEALVTTLLAKSETELKDTYARFISLGLALAYLGCQDKCEVVLSCIENLPSPFRQMTSTLIEICAYAGSGNVLKVQEMLHICTDHYDQEETKKDKKEKKEEKDKDKDKDKDKEKEKSEEKEVDLSSQQAVAVLGIALIAMGEDIGAEMSFRQFGNLLRYCEPVIRRAVPLALGLISVSNPRLNILDTLSKFSHDSDADVAHNAIFAMGLVGAGTNNARLAAMLRQLAQYHAKDPNNLFMVRLAQGLTHLGKGTMTLSPYHSNRQLMSPVAVAGLLATCVAFLDTKTLILGKSHYLLYCLTTAIQPRMLVTFDEQLNPLPVSVRVGQAVDVVGQAGKPKTITGFQTHTTPVLLAHGERAELATDEYNPLTSIMEGFVILKKNPDYDA
ncbi:26S proteasome non-ATPase regulatory subunit 2 [Halocaridina rubra]|uniref:26S proteasome non-ATPase regulatory subunit 2 n=1 Tax=Halocaridina rubra TaxID=373956 RepID=A0AAN8XHV3_HALRR